jgi:glycosyltransferase involved in cell wall biosynthesis
MISVIIPAYNMAQVINRAIDSVLKQHCKDFEIIVIDDGSTDNTIDVVKQYGDKVRLIHQVKQGVSAARNNGVINARGQWIAFLDADDQWLEGKLDRQIQILEKNPSLIWCSTNRFESDGVKKTEAAREKNVLKALEGKDYFDSYFIAAAQGVCPIITSCMIVRKDIIIQLGSFDRLLVRGEDIDLWWRITHRYPQIGYVPQPMIITFLNEEDEDSRKHRIAEWRGDIRRFLIRRHTVFASRYNSVSQFQPFAAKQLKEGIWPMLLGGHGKEARETISEFREFFRFFFMLFVYVITIFPSFTAAILRGLLKIAISLGIAKNVSRAGMDLRHRNPL